jgi:hypothetical protein
MASAPRIRSDSPDTSELGIKTFNPSTVASSDTSIEINKSSMPSQKNKPFKGMSEREQVRMLWGSRRRKTGKSKNKKKKKRSTRRR